MVGTIPIAHTQASRRCGSTLDSHRRLDVQPGQGARASPGGVDGRFSSHNDYVYVTLSVSSDRAVVVECASLTFTSSRRRCQQCDRRCVRSRDAYRYVSAKVQIQPLRTVFDQAETNTCSLNHQVIRFRSLEILPRSIRKRCLCTG